MIFGQDRNELRQMYADAWRKYGGKTVLSPLEAQIAAVIELHPEYHGDVTGEDLSRDYTPDGGQTNPFLHAETLWEAQSGNHPPDEARYLECLQRL